MILVCSTHGLPVRQNFEGYEKKRLELGQLLLQEFVIIHCSSPYTNSLFLGAGDATYKYLLDLYDNSVCIFVETDAKPLENEFSNFEFQKTKVF